MVDPPLPRRASRKVEPVAILGGERIPFARSFTNYRQATCQEMLTFVLKRTVCRFGLEGKRLGEVAGGAVLKSARSYNLTRESLLDSGLALSTPAFDLQQACATSLTAAVLIANKIALGQIDSGIACGVDSASLIPVEVSPGLRDLLGRSAMARTPADRLSAWTSLRPAMLRPEAGSVDEPRTGLSMGRHCEMMAKQWGVSRQDQDELALESHRNGLAAYQRGFYKDLVTPYLGLERDSILREDTSLERLAGLAPAFDRRAGTLTAGNSTPLTDGAAAALLASAGWADANGIEPLAWLIDAESAAVNFYLEDAEGLLMAPAHAVARLLVRNGLTLQDFDFYEIHEAFAAQVLCTLKAWEDEGYCRDRLGLPAPLGAIDRTRLNVNGGSIGLGHPFAATGARILAGAARQLAEHRKQTGKPGRTLISVCAAGGLGVAAIVGSMN
ncbi:MAG: acetyl-CoA C-acetyltransferase [Candidatus Obscuribacterales bacterium]